MSTRLGLAIVALGLVSIGAGWWLRDAWSGQTQPAEADQKLVTCRELVDQFDAYPLLYLGDSFEGLPLTYCGRRQSAGSDYGRPATDRFVFIYGDCEVKSDQSSCNPPLQIAIYPRCGPRLAGGVLRTESIRGAEASVLGTPAFFIETAQFNVKVSGGARDAEGEGLASRAVEELRGANELAKNLTVDKPLADAALVSAPSEEKDACEDSDTLKGQPSATPAPAPFPSPIPFQAPMSASLTVDLDPALPGIQSTQVIPTGEKFEIAIVADNIVAAYSGYQWQLEWVDATLDFVSAVENTAGHGLDLCTAATATTDGALGVPQGKEWTGQGAVCVSLSGTTKFAGTLVTLTLACVADGTTGVRPVPYTEDPLLGSFFVGGTGAPIETAYGSVASLTCGAPSGDPAIGE